jgi:hypothetical protein
LRLELAPGSSRRQPGDEVTREADEILAFDGVFVHVERQSVLSEADPRVLT